MFLMSSSCMNRAALADPAVASPFKPVKASHWHTLLCLCENVILLM